MRCGSCGVLTRSTVSDARVLACSRTRSAALRSRSPSLCTHAAAANSRTHAHAHGTLRGIAHTLAVVGARAGREPRAQVLHLRCELPLVPDDERHRAVRAVALPLRRAAVLQPSFEVLGAWRFTHHILEQSALNREPDGVRRRVAGPSPAPAFAGLQRAQKTAAELDRCDTHGAISSAGAHPGRAGRAWPRCCATSSSGTVVR